MPDPGSMTEWGNVGENIGNLIARRRQRAAQDQMRGLIEEGVKNGTLEPAFDVDAQTGMIKASFRRPKAQKTDSSNYQEGIAQGLSEIQAGADPTATYYKYAQKYPNYAYKIKGAFFTGRGGQSGGSLFDELGGATPAAVQAPAPNKVNLFDELERATPSGDDYTAMGETPLFEKAKAGDQAAIAEARKRGYLR